MAKTACTVPITQIILDEEIYPRSGVYPKRVSMFAENIRDGFKIDPIEVQIHPEYDDKYRILDGAHRWHAYKEIGATEIPVHIITLDGLDPLLYAAKKAILIDSRRLTGDCGHGTCGTGMIVTNVSETIGPVESRPK